MFGRLVSPYVLFALSVVCISYPQLEPLLSVINKIVLLESDVVTFPTECGINVTITFTPLLICLLVVKGFHKLWGEVHQLHPPAGCATADITAVSQPNTGLILQMF